jgi:hypothetical protein
MKCKVIQEQLLNYIDRKLSIEVSQKITSHLLNCEICEKTYRRYQKTHEALKGFGEAVRAGIVDVEAPPLPPSRQLPLWVRIWNGLKTPVPVRKFSFLLFKLFFSFSKRKEKFGWIPSAVSVAVLLMFAVVIFSPLNLSIEWGKEKGGGNTGNIKPPLAAEAMLEFLIVPDPTDSGQLAASIEAVETFLIAHPEDLAMHAKLVELYQAQLKLNSLSETSRAALAKKVSIEQTHFTELLKKTNLTKGAENVEK